MLILLTCRLGFIKVAIQHGYVRSLLEIKISSPLIHVRAVSADLVPVFSFGENDVRNLGLIGTYLELTLLFL